MYIRSGTDGPKEVTFMAKSITACAAALVLLGLLACSSATGPSDDEENVRNLINDKYKAYFDDGSAYGGGKPGGDGLVPGGGSRDAEATLPVFWWRSLTYAQRTIYVTIEAPYTTAGVIVEDELKGVMYVDRTDNKILDPGSKPFHVMRTRHATFERATTDEPWELTAISPAVYAVAEEGRQTVTITGVRVVTENGYDRTFEDMEEKIPLGELPRVSHGEKISVTVKAENTSNEGWVPRSFGFLHHDWRRYDMADKGNRTYEGEYNITAEPGVRHNGVSVIDAGTLQNEAEDDYNADGWSLPFEVE
jgi:hypothetical protein